MNKTNYLVVIAAMMEEVSALTAQMHKVEQQQHAGIDFFCGQLHNHDIIVLQSGIGKVNAAIATTLALEQYHPQFLLNIGSAGGLNKNLQIGDIVLSEAVIHYDADASAFGYQLGQIPQMPIQFPANSDLLKQALIAATQLWPQQKITSKEENHTADIPAIHQGLLGSADRFVAGVSTGQQIQKQFPHLLAIDMEAAAIGQVCFRYQCPFLIARAISDLPAQGNNQIAFDQFLAKAARNSAQLVSYLIQLLP